MKPLITNDAVLLGLLMAILVLVFHTSHSGRPFFQRFYRYVPPLFLCYFLPSLFNITWLAGTDYGFRMASGDDSQLYNVASQYLLPASLVLFTLSIDFPSIRRLGPKALIMFLTGTAGVILGGPLAFWLVSLMLPEVTDGEVWRGFTTVAGSWIGGGANQTAMKEVFEVNDKIFSAMIAVDILTANLWLAFLLYGAGISDRIDRWLKADASAVKEVQKRVEDYQARIARIPSFTDLVTVVGLAFICVGIGHFLADSIAPWIAINAPYLDQFSLTSSFFWVVIIVTTLGLLLSFTPLRELEGVGASKIGSLLLYVLIATIGLKMDVLAITSNSGLFLVGIIWIFTHISLMILVAWLIRAPFFFVAVGSQANIGGAASAPIVATAFHPSLAPVGVLLAVLGYALGTYGAWICGIMLKSIAE
ncbi:MAG: DUF819 family protein [Bacteroidia bacterium]|nr:DUF819 family protein [Bacteroidia bacterium]